MSRSSYVIWGRERVDGACMLYKLSGVEKVFQLLNGVPRAAGFPGDATYSMDPNFPDDMLLTDSLNNPDMLIVVSERLRQLIASKATRGVEYLPVTIIDHKGKAAGRYTIVHPIEPLDCLDLDRCEPRRSRIVKTMIDDVKRLVLDDSKLDPERALFRPLGFPRVVLVRRDVADAISAGGFSGTRWVELDAYPER
ncbi:DUF1629 domain-containing protein [Sorangium sp. So ce1667]